jgi:RHS repeat-associated protein
MRRPRFWRILPALALAGACHGGAPRGRPGEPTSELLARLRAIPGSPLPPAAATGFEPAGGGLKPRFDAGAPVTAHVVLPAGASSAVHLEDAATGLGVDVALAGASPARGQVSGGYLVYPGAHRSGAALVHRPSPSGTEDYLAFDAAPAVAEVAYDLALGKGVSGLRLVAGTLEVLDAGGAPRLRVAPPYLVGADGARTDATLAVVGCAVDASPAAPWGRAVTPPGSARCQVRVTWPAAGVVYPAVLDPRWTTTGAMTTARQGHTATLLSTGNVLVAGGTSNGTIALATAELYNRSTGTWAATASMTGARTLHTATQLNTSSNGTTSGKVLIAGGLNGTTSQSTAQLYSPSAGTWVAAGNLNASRHGHTATLLADGRVLAICGLNGTTTLNTAALYNPASGAGTWAAVAGSLPSALKNHAAALLTTSNAQLSNKVLVFGGNSGAATVSNVSLFDAVKNAFSTQPVMPSAREGHVVTALPNGNLLVTGGKSGTTTLATAVLFNPSSGTGSWTSAGTMTAARQAHSATAIPSAIVASGQVLVAGGSSGSATLSSAEVWNGSTTWTATTALPTARQGHTATLLGNDAVLIAGGVSGTTTLGTTQLYDASFGVACTSNSQCVSGFCVSGVCCDTACNGGCGACNLAGKVGTCSPAASGTVCRASAGTCDVAEACSGAALTCPVDGFQPSTTVCRASAGTCDVAEKCSGTSASCPADGLAASGTVCRVSAGTCDGAESCNGTSASCPADGFQPSTTVCRASAGACDVAEKCSGTSASCPADGLAASGTVCRASAGTCDVAETCSGTSVSCPADGFQPSTAVCRTSAGACDVAEKCSGTSASCPADGFIASGTVCRASAGTCDVAEKCSGTSASCPADGFQPSTTVCRASAGACDVAETCNGTSAACPADGLAASGTVCRASSGACDVAEKCSGTSASCPADGLAASGTVCRASAGTCDVAEMCNGTSATCPVDGFQSSTTVCRASAGACDVAEKCSGTSASCPADGFIASGTVCRASAGICDVAEICSGTSATCPADVFQPSTAVCRASASACDVAESCPGNAAACPADAHQPNGAACSGGNACTTGETCQNVVCTGGAPVTCQSPDQCHTGAGTCSPTTGCSFAAKPDGAACNDNNACTQVDTCRAGACVGANPVQCPPSDGCHQAATCNPTNGICTAPPLADGTCQLGAFDYDKAGRLIRDRQAGLTYDGYDQLRAVTPVAQAPVLSNLPVEEIGDIDGASANAFPTARAINAKGHVTGWATMPSGVTHGFLYDGGGTSIDINEATGIKTELDGFGITSNDIVGGGYFDSTGNERLFTYGRVQGLKDFGVGPAGSIASVQEINDANQFVGTLSLPGGSSHGFRYTAGVGFDDIGTLGGQNSFGFGIDAEGTVLGSAQTPSSPTSGFELFGHAAIYNSEVGLVDLNRYVDPTSGLVLVTTFRSAGNWISGTGVKNGVNSGYRLNVATGMVDDIAAPSGGNLFGYGINSFGEVVGDGAVDGPGTPTVAYIFSDQLGLRKLNDLIDPASGWNLVQANGIDDDGDVTGSGDLNGRFAAYILRLPLRSVSGGAPTVAVAHTYGYDGLRTSTTNAPGTSGASVQFWFTQDYSQHDGVREHYVRVGDRIVAKVTYNPPPGGVGMALVGRLDEKPTDFGDLVAKIILALILALGAAVSAAGFIGKKRRPAWVAAAAGPVALFFVASCEMMGLDSRKSAQTLWQRVATVYFHGGIGPGPALTTASDGSLKEERRYEPFGQPIEADVAGSIGPVDFRRDEQNSLGKLTDPATGWSYHGARWMQPQTARWTSPDPEVRVPIRNVDRMADPWHLNPYVYVSQRPSTQWDPDGAFELAYHEQIVRDAASMTTNPEVVPEMVPRIISANRHQDLGGLVVGNQLDHKLHFDSDRFEKGISYFEKQRDTFLGSLNDHEVANAAGRGSHSIADFYAHSNFIDSFHTFSPNATSAPTFAAVFDKNNPSYEKNEPFRDYLSEHPIISGNFPGIFGGPTHAELNKDKPSATDPEKNTLFDLAKQAATDSTTEFFNGQDPFAGSQDAPFEDP